MQALSIDQFMALIPSKDIAPKTKTTYKSYIYTSLNKLGVEKHDGVFLSMLKQPEDTCKKLKVAGATHTDAKNFYKSLKKLLNIALLNSKDLANHFDSDVCKKINEYNTAFVDKTYGIIHSSNCNLLSIQYRGVSYGCRSNTQPKHY